MMDKFKVGDKACSTICGYYLGAPGTILRRSAFQFDNEVRWSIQLDEVDKIISVPESQIKLLDPEQVGE